MFNRAWCALFGNTEEKKSEKSEKFTVKANENYTGVLVKMEQSDKPGHEVDFLIPLQNFDAEKARLLEGIEVSAFLEQQIQEAKEECEDNIYGFAALGL